MSGFGVGEGSYRQVGAAAKPLPTENGVAGGAGGAGVAGGVVEIISKNIQRVIEKRKVLYL